MSTEPTTNINIVSSTSASTASGDDGTTTSNSVSESAAKVETPPSTVQLPTAAIAAPSPVTTKAKSNKNNNINNNNNNNTDSSNNNNTDSGGSSSSSTKSTPSGKNGKPLTVTVNGNDRSKDLNEHDVVCEKGRGDHERWPGNKLYRHLINVNKETYNDLAPIERSNIIGTIIGTIQEKDGWFVHHSEATGKWAKLTEEKVRKKVSDDLRREVRRRREKRSHNSLFSAKLRAIKEMEEAEVAARDILERVDDPRQSDVLFGPGARRHPGNKIYWHHMKLNLDQYIISPYGARSVISRNIVQIIRSQHGRFLEQDPKTGIWYSISDKRALEKTSHALSNMKYKTRKRHPDEPPFPPPAMYGHHHVPHGFVPAPPHHLHHLHHHHHPHHRAAAAAAHHHHLAAAAGYRPYGEEIVYDDDVMDQEKILEGDSPNTIFAKKRTKKFRLLNRMDDVPGAVGVGAPPPSVVVAQTPLKGMDSNAAPLPAVDAPNSAGTSDKDHGKQTDNNNTNNIPNNNSTSKHDAAADPTTTTPEMTNSKGVGKIISPNSSSHASESGVEYQEQRNPNAYRRFVHHVPAVGVHTVAASELDYHHRGGATSAEIAPRLSHFDYLKHYHGAPPPAPNGAAFKTLTYAAGMRADEYAAPPPHHHPSAQQMRRYLAPNLVAAAAHVATAHHHPGQDAAALNSARRWAAAASEYY